MSNLNLHIVLKKMIEKQEFLDYLGIEYIAYQIQIWQPNVK